jgi:anti-anti-sigma factor
VEEAPTGQLRGMSEHSPTPAAEPAEPAPQTVEVVATRDDSAEVRVAGELTEETRRPLVRTMTELMLSRPGLRRVVLDLCDVTFMNSAGMAALVQVERMGQPRAIGTTLVVRSAAVARPLQLSGLWRRFTIVDRREGRPEETHEPMPPGGEHS